MLRVLRQSMHDRDSRYRLSGLIEIDDALVGGRRAAGYLAARVLPDGVKQAAVRDEFAHHHFAETGEMRSDALPALASLGERHIHEPRVTPPEQARQWLPKVHLITANLQRFVLGTFHGVSGRYLQDYIDEFVYHFNRPHWDDQLPQRLLEATVAHVPVPTWPALR